MAKLFLSLISVFHYTAVVVNGVVNGTSTFTFDSAWPDPSTVQSLQVHGSAVAVDWNQNVIILHRGSNNTKSNSAFIEEDVIMIVSSTNGKILASWGANKFVKPHGIALDGRNIFITDVVLHQVFKFLYDAKTGLWKLNASLELGEKLVSGNDAFHFCSPADVAVSSETGEFYVADGYCNSRIVHFSKEGIYKSEFYAGMTNSGLIPGIAEFNITHSVTIAETPRSMNMSAVIFVADRNNGRIQSFLEDGTFLYEIPYQAFCKTREMLLSVVFHPINDFKSFDEPFGTLHAVIGHLPVGHSKIFEILVGSTGYHIRSSFLFTPGLNNSNSLANNQVETPHDLAISEDGKVLYVIESNSRLAIKKFVKSQPHNSTYLANDSSKLNIGVTFFLGFLFVLNIFATFN